MPEKHSRFTTPDSETLSRIEQDHPATWNTDAMFEKSYERYLLAKQSVPAAEPTPPQPVRRLTRFHPERIAVAACAALALLMFRGLTKMQTPDIQVPEIEQSTTIPTTQATPAATDHAVTSGSSRTTMTGLTSAANWTSDEKAGTTTFTTAGSPAATEQTDPVPEITTEASSVTTAEVSSQSTEATTLQPENPWGYFFIEYGHLTYHSQQTGEIPAVQYEVALDGFTVSLTSKSIYADSWGLQDNSNGEGFQLVVFPYPYFQVGSQLKGMKENEYVTTTMPDGKPACVRWFDGSVQLFWDTGYGICYCVGSRAHYDAMQTLAQQLIFEEVIE